MLSQELPLDFPLTGPQVRHLAIQSAKARAEGHLPPEPTAQERLYLGGLLYALLDRSDLVIIDRHVEDGFCLTASAEDGQRISVNRDSLLATLEAAVEGDPMKRCRKCHRSKPLYQFCVNRSNADGRHIYCRKCQSVANAKQTSRKREARQSLRAAAQMQSKAAKHERAKESARVLAN